VPTEVAGCQLSQWQLQSQGACGVGDEQTGSYLSAAARARLNIRTVRYGSSCRRPRWRPSCRTST